MSNNNDISYKDIWSAIPLKLRNEMGYFLKQGADSPSEENLNLADKAWQILGRAEKVVEWKLQLEDKVARFGVPEETQRALVAACDDFLENPTDANYNKAQTWWDTVNSVEVSAEDNSITRVADNITIRNMDTPSDVLVPNDPAPIDIDTSKPVLKRRFLVPIAALMGLSFTGIFISPFAVIAPNAVPVLGEQPLVNSGFGLVMLMIFAFSVTYVIQQGESISPRKAVSQESTRAWLPLVLITLSIFLAFPVFNVASQMLGVPVLTSTIMLPAFLLLPLSMMAFLQASALFVAHWRYATIQRFSPYYALLTLMAGSIFLAGLMRWLAFSFINVVSYPEVVASGILSEGVINVGLMAHGMIIATLVLFLTCLMALVDYLVFRVFSAVTVIITILAILYGGLLTFSNQRVLSPPEQLYMLGNAPYIAGTLTNTVAVILLGIFFIGLLYIILVTLWHFLQYPSENNRTFRLALALVIFLYGMGELIALAFQSLEIASIPLENFPSAEIMLAAAVVWVLLELNKGDGWKWQDRSNAER